MNTLWKLKEIKVVNRFQYINYKVPTKLNSFRNGDLLEFEVSESFQSIYIIWIHIGDKGFQRLKLTRT